MKYKAKEVALALGLSEATVSLALNGKSGVSEKTRQRVLKYIADLEENRENLPAAGKPVIKVVLYVTGLIYYDDLTSQLFSQSYIMIMQMATERGMDVRLVYLTSEEESEELLEESEKDGTVGIFLMASSMPERIFAPFRDSTIPIVVDGADFEDSPFDVVMIDNRDAVIQSMKYLTAQGHREILFCENSARLYNFDSRKRAYERFCQKTGLSAYFVTLGENIEDSLRLMNDYIRRSGKLSVTAVFAENYAVAAGAILALEQNGYRIPEDISVIGIDDLPEHILTDFSYTHMKIDHNIKCVRTVNCLLERIEHPVGGRVKLYVGASLMLGNSVKKIGQK